MSNMRDVISNYVGVIDNHSFLLDKSLKAEDPLDPLNPKEDETAAAKNAT